MKKAKKWLIEFRARLLCWLNVTQRESEFDETTPSKFDRQLSDIVKQRQSPQSEPIASIFPARPRPMNIDGHFHTLAGSVTSTNIDGPGVALDAGSILGGSIELRAASLVGDEHIMEGTRRQDAYAIRSDENKRILNLAVCDGVGSRRLGNEGAVGIAMGVVWHASQGCLDPVGESVKKIVRLANSKGVHPEEYATTLIWVQIKMGELGAPWEVDLVHYGDGDVRVLENKQWFQVDPRAPAGEEDSSSFALPLATRPGRKWSFFWQPEQVMVLATDGLSHHLDSRSKVGHFLAEAWQQLPDRWEFLSQIAFRAEGAGDDRTGIVLWRTDQTNRSCHYRKGVVL